MYMYIRSTDYAINLLTKILFLLLKSKSALEHLDKKKIRGKNKNLNNNLPHFSY